MPLCSRKATVQRNERFSDAIENKYCIVTIFTVSGDPRDRYEPSDWGVSAGVETAAGGGGGGGGGVIGQAPPEEGVTARRSVHTGSEGSRGPH